MKTGLVTHKVGGYNVRSVAISPDGEFVYLEIGSGKIMLYQAGYYVLVNRVPQFWESNGMYLTADGKALYSFSRIHRELGIIDTWYLETGYSMPDFPGNGASGSHIFPLFFDRLGPAILQMLFEPSRDGLHVVVAGDHGNVIVLKHENEGQNVIPSIVFRGVSTNLSRSFAQNANPPKPVIRWTSSHTFEIEVDGEIEKYEFKTHPN